MALSSCLLACALPKETKALRPIARNWAVDLVTTGLGGKRTVAALRRELSTRAPSLLIFTGVAGALSPDLSMGQSVFPEEWMLENEERFSGDPALIQQLRLQQWQIAGLGLTVSRPVLRSESRERLHRSTGALICDMEAAHAMRLAGELKIPALALKVVSDTQESGLTEFWRQLDANLERLRSTVEQLLHDLGIPPK